jgi:hypothetical protein
LSAPTSLRKASRNSALPGAISPQKATGMAQRRSGFLACASDDGECRKSEKCLWVHDISRSPTRSAGYRRTPDRSRLSGLSCIFINPRGSRNTWQPWHGNLDGGGNTDAWSPGVCSMSGLELMPANTQIGVPVVTLAITGNETTYITHVHCDTVLVWLLIRNHSHVAPPDVTEAPRANTQGVSLP